MIVIKYCFVSRKIFLPLWIKTNQSPLYQEPMCVSITCIISGPGFKGTLQGELQRAVTATTLCIFLT